MPDSKISGHCPLRDQSSEAKRWTALWLILRIVTVVVYFWITVVILLAAGDPLWFVHL